MNLPAKIETEISKIICNDCNKELHGLSFDIQISRGKKDLGWATAYCSCSVWEFDMVADEIVKIKQTKTPPHPKSLNGVWVK